MNKVWIIERSKRNGQLCNRLGLFAHFVAYCAENQDSLVNLNFFEYAKGFQNLSQGLVVCFPQRKIAVPWNGITYRAVHLGVNTLKKLSFSHSFEAEVNSGEALRQDFFDLEKSCLSSEIGRSKFIFCKGWRFRCFGVLAKHATTVRKFFEFDKRIESDALERSIELRNSADILIAIHMRLGDYKHHWGGRFYYEPLEYKKVMQTAQEIFQDKGNVKFVVFSNEKQSSNFFNSLNVDISHGSALQDLALMSKCDYILGPPSSFSNWASFYGGTPLHYIQNPNVIPQAKDFRVHLPLDMGV